MKKIVLTFGTISGVIISAMMLLTIPFQDAIGFDRGEVIGYTSMVLAFLLIFFGVRSYRDTVGRGRIGFGRAFGLGALIVVVSAAFYVATWEVIYYKITPDFPAKYAAHMVEKARASGASQVVIDKKIADMQKFAELYKNPLVNIAMTFLEPLPVGLVIALISAGILRTRQKGRAPAVADVPMGGASPSR